MARIHDNGLAEIGPIQEGGPVERLLAIHARLSIEDAINEMREGLAEKRATGAEIKVPYYFGLLAEAHRRHRRINNTMEGLKLLSDALEFVERTDERWYEAELYRLRGEMLTKNADRRGAESDF